LQFYKSVKFVLFQNQPIKMIFKNIKKLKKLSFLSYCFRWIFLLMFLVAILPESHYAQSIGGIDIKNVKVDDLSDEQIRGYIQQAEEQGLTQTQLEALARQRGVPESEIAKLRRRVVELGNSTAVAGKGLEKSSTARSTTNVIEYDPFGMLVGEERQLLSEEEQKIFGYDLFLDNNLTFAPNLDIPTPVDYKLGPKDVLNIDLWGETQQFISLEVSNEGVIRPENLSPIYVNGLTIEEAQKKIIERASQIYSGLRGTTDSPATIFLQVSLGNIRTINVTIVGQVKNPASYSLPSLATIYNALHAAGGPNVNGSFRDIRLVRKNKHIETLDIYEFLLNGIKQGDLRLEDGDVIVVRPFVSRIELEGEVKRAGYYELKSDESFLKLMEFSGGFSNSAYKELITVKRNSTKEREISDVKAENFHEFLLNDGDYIKVNPILERYSNRVMIEGAVYREGEYQLTEGLTLKLLIQKADGLRGDVFMDRATIYRTNEDFSQEPIPIDLVGLMSGRIPDIILIKEDLIKISSIYDLREEFIVQISGEIIEAGVFPFFNNMTVQDLIVLSGGLKESASGSFVEISRRNKNDGINNTAEIVTFSIDPNLLLNNEDRSQILQPFDQVYIRQSPGYDIQREVTVEGEVLGPGLYSIQRKDERISDIIIRAQGLTPYAYPEGALLVRKTEFSGKKSNDQISLERLQQLRKKILSNEDESLTLSQEALIDRLDKLEKRNSTVGSNDQIGSQIKKDLVEDLAKQDSLISEVKLLEQEPVALDLKLILENPGSKYDFIIRDGDVISIPGKLETVRVAGEVTSTLNLRFDEKFKFKDYINDAGGYTIEAKKSRSYVQYPNGKRQGVKRVLFFKKYPKIEPGSTIFVSRKPEKEGMNLQAILAVTSTLLTMVLVIDNLNK
jgi:protein involved in polysaccharide export with SLBB domain